MAVCKFFLQGYCRNGNNCRFEHPAGAGGANQNQGYNQGQYSGGRGRGGRGGRGGHGPGGRGNAPPPQQNRQDTLQSMMDAIKEDLQAQRPEWICSCYDPEGKNSTRQLIDGLPSEQSPEELRVRFYMAQAAGNPQLGDAEEKQLAAAVNEQVQTILGNLRAAAEYVLAGRDIHPNRIDICNENSSVINESTGRGGASGRGRRGPFGGSNRGPTGPASFAKPSQSPFGQQPSSPFGQNQQTQTPFGQQQNASPFGQQTSSPFGQQNQAQQNQSPFGQQAGGQTGGFGQPQAPGAGFGQSPFGQGAAAATPAPGPFGQPSQGGFGQQQQLLQQPIQGGVGQQQQPGPFGQPAMDANPAPFQSQPQAPAPPSGFGNAFAQPPQPTNGLSTTPFGASAAEANKPAFGQTPAAATAAFGQPAMAAPTPAFSQAVPAPGPTQFEGGQPNPNATYNAAGQLQTWHGQPVRWENNLPYFLDPTTGKPTRIFHPNGTPATFNQYAAPTAEEIANAGGEEKLMAIYQQAIHGGGWVNDQGQILVPEVPPKPEWSGWNV